MVQHGSIAGPQATTGLQENKTNLLLSLVEDMMWPSQKTLPMPGTQPHKKAEQGQEINFSLGMYVWH